MERKCPYCDAVLSVKSAVCPTCKHFLGNFIQHLLFFFKTQLLSAVMLALVSAIIGGFVTSYFTKVLPEKNTESVMKLALSKESVRLSYASEVKKVGSWTVLGIKVGDCFIANIGVENRGPYKLNDVKIHLIFSNKVYGHYLSSGYEISDGFHRIINLQRHFSGKQEVTIITPELLPEQAFPMSFYFNGDVEIKEIEVSSKEAVGIKSEFAKQ